MHHTIESKRKISEANKGRKHSQKTREKQSVIAKKRFENPQNHPCFGKHLSENTKHKISQSHLRLKLKHNPNNYYIKMNLNDNESLCYLLGALLGDGNLYRATKVLQNKQEQYDYTIRLKVIDEDFARTVEEFLRIVGLNPKTRRVFYGINKNKIAFLVQARSKMFYNWYYKTKDNLQEFVNKNTETQIAFLKGFFEAEGSFSIGSSYDKRRNKSYIKYVVDFSNNDIVLINITKNILIKLGLHPWVRQSKNKSGTITHKIVLSKKEEIKTFLETIQPCIQRKKWHEYGCS